MLFSLLLAVIIEAEDVRTLEKEMTELVNVEREARGLQPLESREELVTIAREYSARMASMDEVHHGLDRPVQERILDVLPSICRFGENVSKHTSITYSIGDMLNSEGHRANLLHEKFTLIGVGIVRDDGYLYITLEFARPCDRPLRRR